MENYTKFEEKSQAEKLEKMEKILQGRKNKGLTTEEKTKIEEVLSLAKSTSGEKALLEKVLSSLESFVPSSERIKPESQGILDLSSLESQLSILFADNLPREVRCIGRLYQGTQGITTLKKKDMPWFTPVENEQGEEDQTLIIAQSNQPGEIIKAIRTHFDKETAANLYITVNPCHPRVKRTQKAVKIGGQNKLVLDGFKAHDGTYHPAITGEEIVETAGFLVDLDRYKTQENQATLALCASQQELEKVKKGMARVVSIFGAWGFVPSYVLCSGNGYQALYLFAPTADRELLLTSIAKEIIVNLAKILACEEIGVDTAVIRKAQLCRLAGVLNAKPSRKEIPEEGRVYRVAKLVYSEYHLNPFDTFPNGNIKACQRAIASLTSESGAKTSEGEKQKIYPTTNNRPINPSRGIQLMEGIKALCGDKITVTKEVATAKGRRYWLRECVHNSTHKDSSQFYADFEKGILTYFCFHASCQEKNHLRNALESLGLEDSLCLFCGGEIKVETEGDKKTRLNLDGTKHQCATFFVECKYCGEKISWEDGIPYNLGKTDTLSSRHQCPKSKKEIVEIAQKKGCKKLKSLIDSAFQDVPNQRNFIETNEQYLPSQVASLIIQAIQDFETTGAKSTIVIKSPTGSGKSYLLKAVKDAIPQSTFLYSTNSRNLTRDVSQRLGITNYLDYYNTQEGAATPAKPTESMALCCLSYSKVVNDLHSPFHTKLSLLVWDESEGMARLLSSNLQNEKTTIKKSDTLDALDYLASKAGVVLAMDATLGEGTVELVKQYRGDTTLTAIYNGYSGAGKVDYYHDSLDSIVSWIEQVLKNGGRLWVALNGKGTAKTLAEASNKELRTKKIKDQPITEDETADKKTSEGIDATLANLWAILPPGKKMLLLTSDNIGDTEQQAFIANPTEESKKYDLIITSPVINAGLSIDTHNHFTHRVGIFYNSNFTSTPEDCHQQIERVRNPINRQDHILIFDSHLDLAETENDLMACFSPKLLASEATLWKRAVGIDTKFIHKYPKYEALWLVVRGKNNRQKNSFTRTFRTLRTASGVETTELFEPPEKGEKEAITSNLKECRLAKKTAEIEEIYNAYLITSRKEFDETQKKKRTPKIAAKLEKYRIAQIFGVQSLYAGNESLYEDGYFDKTEDFLQLIELAKAGYDERFLRLKGLLINLGRAKDISLERRGEQPIYEFKPLLSVSTLFYGENGLWELVGIDPINLVATGKTYTAKDTLDFLGKILDNYNLLHGWGLPTKKAMTRLIYIKPLQALSRILDSIGLKQTKHKDKTRQSRSYQIDKGSLDTLKTCLIRSQSWQPGEVPIAIDLTQEDQPKEIPPARLRDALLVKMESILSTAPNKGAKYLTHLMDGKIEKILSRIEEEILQIEERLAITSEPKTKRAKENLLYRLGNLQKIEADFTAAYLDFCKIPLA